MASDARVLFQLKPLTSLLPPEAAALTQDYHTLNRLLGL
jgi:hypothetical protein